MEKDVALKELTGGTPVPPASILLYPDYSINKATYTSKVFTAAGR